MKIVSIEYTQENIQLNTPFKTALRSANDVAFVRVCVRCDDARYAYGEAPATKAITGEGIEEIESSLQKVSELFIGKNIQDALSLLDTLELGGNTKAALDIALVFLDAQEQQKSLYQYFEIQNKEALKSAITISFNKPQEMLRDAVKAYENGMDILKIKLAKDISHAIEVVTLIASKLPKALLLIDANQAWDLQGSKRFLEASSTLNLVLLEQALKAKDLEGMRELCTFSSIPILADESVFTLEDMRYVVENACADMINIKLMKCGGVRQAQKMLEYARSKKIQCMMGSMLEGPNSIRAALYLSFAYRDVIAYFDLDSPMLYKKSQENMPKDFSYEHNKISFTPKD